MDIRERIELFHGMLQCNYNVYLWEYDKDFNLLFTNCDSEALPGDMATTLGFEKILLQQAKECCHLPLLLNNDFGLIWIAALEYQKMHIKKFYLLGPAFTGSDSPLLLRKKLESYGFSIKLNLQILHVMEKVPIIPATILLQYGVMLHYAVTGEQISTSQVHSLSVEQKKETEEISLISKEHRGVYMAEKQLLQAFRDGNAEYLKAIDRSMSLSTGLQVHLNDSLREGKNNLLVLLTLCSRASMEGGLNPSIAYSLNDYYAERIEHCKNTAQLNALAKELMQDYIYRVRERKAEDGRSTAILDACDYITMHLREVITLKDLADRSGYTEYYFSKKFKKETGMTVNEYVCRKKTEYACELLKSTNLKVEDIMEETGFASKSHFYASFQKIIEMSPLDYRERNS